MPSYRNAKMLGVLGVVSAIGIASQLSTTGLEAPAQPSILGRGSISLPDRHEFCSTLTRDGRTAYVGIEHGDWQSIVSYSWDGNNWVGPIHILGSPEYSAQDPYLSKDETRLYFTTRVNGHADIGYLQLELDDEWSEPVLLDDPVNSPGNEYYTSFTSEGDLVFASDREKTQRGDYDIYRAHKNKVGFDEPVPFPEGINTIGYEADPFIDPGGRYLIFASTRSGGRGRGDLYLSVALDDDQWSQPIPFDNSINTTAHELCPAMSLDGTEFMFTSDKDIRWVSSTVVDRLVDEFPSENERGVVDRIGQE
ncbi:TolB family protein [Aestuariibius sp. 2305UL40-4]|uniref:TolB family protein n=1 Tax=Aestuariibius violaceus TaxID=3234132 RepID=UPI00398F80FD